MEQNKTKKVKINCNENNLEQIELKIMERVYQEINAAEKETGLIFDSLEFNEIEQRMYIKLKQL